MFQACTRVQARMKQSSNQNRSPKDYKSLGYLGLCVMHIHPNGSDVVLIPKGVDYISIMLTYGTIFWSKPVWCDIAYLHRTDGLYNPGSVYVMHNMAVQLVIPDKLPCYDLSAMRSPIERIVLSFHHLTCLLSG
jgi:hypothetical protein